MLEGVGRVGSAACGVSAQHHVTPDLIRGPAFIEVGAKAAGPRIKSGVTNLMAEAQFHDPYFAE